MRRNKLNRWKKMLIVKHLMKGVKINPNKHHKTVALSEFFSLLMEMSFWIKERECNLVKRFEQFQMSWRNQMD